MNKFSIPRDSKFSELDLEPLKTMNFSIYLLDREWNYLFVNDFAQKNLGKRGHELEGKNLWKEFEELSRDPSFITLKRNSERGGSTNIVTTSPITSQRLNIVGYPLQDCFFFYTSILPNKDDLMQELRSELNARKS